MEREIIIDGRFRGPPDSANGGYAAGVVAEGIETTVAVSLRAPPPLDTPMRLEGDGETSRLVQADVLIAEASPATLNLEVPDPPSLAEAVEASKRFVWAEGHRLPHCFVCGTDRRHGDGLRIFAGPLAGSDVVAAPWLPEPSLVAAGEPLDRRYVWSALDCPSYFGLATTPAALLGRLTADISRVPTGGEQLIAMAWPISADGRKHVSASALVTPDGTVIARAEAIWIELEEWPY
ncbi:MAG: hypothetical protein BMS9Abin07_1911 [Acidimicrobiia bacterium]|nr:MAG: hypothetical protein BMS9Abin07_1911 [Acidimicrobiia bacterium]